MRPENCKLEGFLYAMIASDPRCNEDVCKDCNYSIDECCHSKMVSVGFSMYKIVELEKNEVLPKTRTWCKDCTKESAVPVATVTRNGEMYYVLQCTTCKTKYTMSVQDYRRKYIGYTNGFGDFIPASYAKDNKRPEYLDKKYEKEFANRRLKLWTDCFGYSEEEAKAKIQQLKDDEKKSDIEFKKSEKQRSNKYRNELEKKQSNAKSDERKKLIEEGILIYNKKAGCLVNKETGEVYKL